MGCFVVFCLSCTIHILSLFFFFPKIQSFAYGLLLSHTWDFKYQQIYHSIGKENTRKHILKSTYHVLKPTYCIYYQVWQAATNKAKKIEITEVSHNSCSPSFQNVVHQQSSVTKLSAWPPLLPDFCRDGTANSEELLTLSSWTQRYFWKISILEITTKVCCKKSDQIPSQ